jgi:hypothetical protein
MAAPERFAKSQIPLAPRAPSIHGPRPRTRAGGSGYGGSPAANRRPPPGDQRGPSRSRETAIDLPAKPHDRPCEYDADGGQNADKCESSLAVLELFGRGNPVTITSALLQITARCRNRPVVSSLAAVASQLLLRREVAHSITSSARASSVSGTARPSAFAVLRLIAISILLDC